MNSEDVYLELSRIGCCSRCCLRFLGNKFSNFEDPLRSLEELLPITLENEIKSKKFRPNTCCVCLGLLQDSFLDEILAHSCWSRLQEYESDNYRINLNTPPNMAIREKALRLHLKQKFPVFYELNDNENSPLIPIVFKLAFKRRLDEYCGKKYDVFSRIQLWTTLHHDDNNKEVEVIQRLENNRGNGRRRFSDKKRYSKNNTNHILSSVDDETFAQFIRIPPEIPSRPLHIYSVSFESLPIFICGRYCKYSREISQTPYSTDDIETSGTDDELQLNYKIRNSTSSVLSILINGLHQVFGFDKEKIKFAASGREDIDVRCLGNGRPFFMKIETIRKTMPDELFRKLEEVINKSPDVSVFDMQQTDKNCMRIVKTGEEIRRKIYVALCLIREPKLLEEIINRINRVERNLLISQKAPISVANRRSHIVRQKHIHSMKAAAIPGHDRIFQLTLVTQAGTYVKEFIHGDFGRTSPSLSSLVKVELDIFRLDAVGVDLDWPKHINSVPHPLLSLIKKEKNIVNEANPHRSDLVQRFDGGLNDFCTSVKDELV